jgi:hypothetical protein
VPLEKLNVKKERKKKEKSKNKKKSLTTTKKLIKLVNSLAAAPKTWCDKSASAGFIEVVKREYRSDIELFNSINLYG